MPKNTSGSQQYIHCHGDDVFHFAILDPDLHLDSGQPSVNIFPNRGLAISYENTLDVPKKAKAKQAREKIEDTT